MQSEPNVLVIASEATESAGGGGVGWTSSGERAWTSIIDGRMRKGKECQLSRNLILSPRAVELHKGSHSNCEDQSMINALGDSAGTTSVHVVGVKDTIN